MILIAGVATTTVACDDPGGPWSNAPAGWTTVFETPFSSTTDEGWGYYNGASLGSDPTAPRSPSSVAQFSYSIGHSGGNSAGVLERLSGAVSTHYAGFWIKLNSAFDNRFGFKTWYPHQAAGGYAVIVEGEDHGADAWTLRIEGNALNCPSNVVANPLTPGVWHQVEVLWNQQSQNLKFWLDGVLVGNCNVSWSLNMDYARFATTWAANTGQSVQVASYMWIDHAIMTRP